jgi:subtilisin family serine protease
MTNGVLAVDWHGEDWDAAIAARADIAIGGGPGDPVLYRPHELIVTAAALATPEFSQALTDAGAAPAAGDLAGVAALLGLALWTVPDGVDLPALVRSLRAIVPRGAALHAVLIAGPQRWGGDGAAQPFPPPADIPGTDAAAGAGVAVAVLDTGIDAQAAITVVAGARDYEIADEDQDGRLDEAAGHGTHVAGLVSRGAGGAEIRSRRVLKTPAGEASELEVAQVLLDVGDAGVVNCSFGGFSLDDSPPLVLERAVAALPQTTAVVAAAGNHGIDRPHWPAALKRVVAVAAAGQARRRAPWQRADFSGYGTWVDCCAPGVRVPSIFLRFTEDPKATKAPRDFQGGARWSGTSFAAPQVSAAVAVAAARDSISPREAAVGLIVRSQRAAIPGAGPLILP